MHHFQLLTAKRVDDRLYRSSIYSKNYEGENHKTDLDSLFNNYKNGLFTADWFAAIPKNVALPYLRLYKHQSNFNLFGKLKKSSPV